MWHQQSLKAQSPIYMRHLSHCIHPPLGKTSHIHTTLFNASLPFPLVHSFYLHPQSSSTFSHAPHQSLSSNQKCTSPLSSRSFFPLSPSLFPPPRSRKANARRTSTANASTRTKTSKPPPASLPPSPPLGLTRMLACPPCAVATVTSIWGEFTFAVG